MGGQQPITGSTISLYAAGITGYGSSATLLASTTTDAGGGFTLPVYTCPAIDRVTYLVASGGNTGSGTNPLAVEAALLPRCSQLSTSTFIVVSEATTVAAAYALAPFASVSAAGTNIGTSATNLQGLNNSLAAANNLVNFSSGFPRQAAELPGIVAPAATMATLADILAACVNTSGAIASGNACGTLFTATTVGGVAPTDTLQAAFNMALHPGMNVATLYGLSASNPPFGGGLSSAPPDFTLALAFTAGGIAQATTGVAIDAAGNAWIATGEFNNSVHALTEISPAGVYLSGASGFGSSVINGPEAIAFTPGGSLYLDCAGGNNLLRFDSTGNYLSTIAAGSFKNPNGLAVNATGDVLVSNFNGTSLSRILDASQTEAANSPIATGTEGVEVAVSTTATWVANYQSNTLSRLANISFARTSIGTSSTPSGIAIDGSDNVWTTLLHGVAKYSDGGALISPAAGYQGNTSLIPQSVVVDGLGHVFASAYVSNTSHGSLLEFDGSGALLSPLNGFLAANTISVKPAVPGGIAIDGSGNIWITGDANGTSTTPTVSEVIGLAAPVTTPRSLAVTKGIASRP